MSLSLHQTDKKESLYMQVYHHYRELIMERRLPARSRMPSLRKCAEELNLSRTTIESAYLQLAADGYIIARAQSGYYVTDIASLEPVQPKPRNAALPEVRYDFASAGVDRESFRFDLWQRYIKSALRQNDRLLSYGEPQGEEDREAKEDSAHWLRSQYPLPNRPHCDAVGHSQREPVVDPLPPAALRRREVCRSGVAHF